MRIYSKNDAALRLHRRSHAATGASGSHTPVCVGYLAVLPDEADECVDWLEYVHDMKIAMRPELLQESRELARIFAKALKTAVRILSVCEARQEARRTCSLAHLLNLPTYFSLST